MENLVWKEIKSNKVRVFGLEDEPYVIYLIRIRENEFMVLHEDGWDNRTGKVEFMNEYQIYDKFGIEDNFKK